jgi:DnaJ family protein B protein 4
LHIKIPSDKVIKPGAVKVIPKEGMPIQNEPNQKGDLFLVFHIQFPEVLTSQQQEVFSLR